MEKITRLLGLSILFFIFSAMSGRPGSGKENAGLKEEALKTLHEMESAFEHEDAGRFMEWVSDRYLSKNPAELESVLQARFEDADQIDITLGVESTILSSNRKTAAVKTRWQRRWLPKGSNQAQLSRGRTEFVFIRENESVKLQSSRGDGLFE